VCGGLLARFAFEAGMPLEQQILDESRAAQILNEAIDEVIEGKDADGTTDGGATIMSGSGGVRR
jgi:hypothetical protein